MVTKGVPCEKRIKDLQKFHELYADELEKDAGDGWVETSNPDKGGGKMEDIMDIDDMGDDAKMQVIASKDDKKDDGSSDGFDLDDMDDDNAFAQPAKQEEEKKASEDN